MNRASSCLYIETLTSIYLSFLQPWPPKWRVQIIMHLSPPSSFSMEICSRLLLFFLLSFFFVAAAAVHSSSSSSPISLADVVVKSAPAEFRNHTAISEFRVVNRKPLKQCLETTAFLKLRFDSNATLSDDQYVRVHVDGVLHPSQSHWVALVSPSHSSVSDCPLNVLQYVQTGDLSKLPLLCHYPVKAQYVSSDPAYLSCGKKECQMLVNGKCVVQTCSATLTFHVINFRTDIEFVMFSGGFEAPCLLARSGALSFSNPHSPLYAHLSSIDSTATSMRVTWVSGDKTPQQLQYDNGKSQKSVVTTFTQDQMCSAVLKSPAKDFGWHDPGYVHSAIMTGLKPSTTYTYTYGSDSSGWSNEITFKTPPAGGSDEVRFLAFGDMGKTPRDRSAEHYTQPGALSVVKALVQEVSLGKVDSIFHIGDISYATGFLVEWDYFLHLITPIASRISYMTAIGNHERDYVGTGSVYKLPDSGGECGIPYETYFPMPTPAKDKPWYSIEQGSVHFTVISTEHSWYKNSEQYEWMKRDMAAVDRARTPWLIFTGHRPMYSSYTGLFINNVDKNFVIEVEPLLLDNKVDLALWGHVHNYERTCAVYAKQCKAMPVKDRRGIDTYNNTDYKAPVHAVIGMGGFRLDPSPVTADSWSLVRISEYGYARLHATKKELKVEYMNANSGNVRDSFQITKATRK